MDESKKVNRYKAHFSFAGFNRVVNMVGEPSATAGFSIPAPASLDTSATLSIYFWLRSYNGKDAYYTFSGWRQM